MLSTPDTTTEALIAETHRRLVGESYPRIRRCIESLTDDQIWWKPNKNSNSIGNLVMHLNGNLRQWVLSGIAGKADVRQRDIEFKASGELSGQQLLELLDETILQVQLVLIGIKPDQLLETHAVQVFTETTLSILVHIIEHTSYHTGQIAWITKMLIDEQLNFYGDLDLG